MKLKINKPFRSNAHVDPFDTRQMKRALNLLGYYTPEKTIGIHDIVDKKVFTALEKFQTDHALQPTGQAIPNDQTVETINNKLNQEKDIYYIWRTVGDDKVRDGHAALDGEVRHISDSPQPGEEYNCRCWADPITGEKIPIPSRKPNCDKEKQEVTEVHQNFEKLKAAEHRVLGELKALVEENNDIVGQMKKTLGLKIATSIIEAPMGRGGVIKEIIQRILGNTVSNEVLENADELANKLTRVRRQIEYKKIQLQIIVANMNNTQKALKDAEKALQNCKKGTHSQ